MLDNKMRGKVGYLLINEHKFPIWVSNFCGDKSTFDIQIYCDVKLQFLLMEYLIEREFNARYLYGDNTAFYKISTRENILAELKSLMKDKLAKIDFNKLDNFLFKIDKYFVVKRLDEG